MVMKTKHFCKSKSVNTYVKCDLDNTCKFKLSEHHLMSVVHTGISWTYTNYDYENTKPHLLIWIPRSLPPSISIVQHIQQVWGIAVYIITNLHNIHLGLSFSTSFFLGKISKKNFTSNFFLSSPVMTCKSW